MLNFEEYLSDFNNTVNIWEFLLNLLLVSMICFGIKIFYVKYGRALTDRQKFSNNFIPLAVSTLLIITVIKSSIALSLGLVGALSIVRFRAAIKDPEELTFLFLVIGMGLIGGANKPILLVVSFLFILPIFYFNSKMSKQKTISKNKTFLNIKSKNANLAEITSSTQKHVGFLELKRVDFNEDGVYASFNCQIDGIEKVADLNKDLSGLDPNISVSLLDQPDVFS